jgi:hypothetical protein
MRSNEKSSDEIPHKDFMQKPFKTLCPLLPVELPTMTLETMMRRENSRDQREIWAAATFFACAPFETTQRLENVRAPMADKISHGQAIIC